MPPKRKAPTSKRSRSRGPSYKRSRVPQNVVALYNRRPEVKRVDVMIPGATNNFSTTVHFDLLNKVRLGNDDYQRIGKEIKMQSLFLCGQIVNLPTANANASDYIRYMVIYDRQPNGAVPTIQNLITSVDSAGANTNLVTDQYNHDYSDRFKILLDKSINFPSDVRTGADLAHAIVASPAQTTVKHYIPLNKLSTKYTSDADSIASISTGSLYLVLYGLNPTANANWAMNATARLNYFDY